MQGEAGRVILDFAGQNVCRKSMPSMGPPHSRGCPQNKSSEQRHRLRAPQDFELAASGIDFTRRARPHPAARLNFRRGANHNRAGAGVSSGSYKSPSLQKTVATAGKFDAEFSESLGRNHLASVHGAPDARIVSSAPGQPDRVSTAIPSTPLFSRKAASSPLPRKATSHTPMPRLPTSGCRPGPI